MEDQSQPSPFSSVFGVPDRTLVERITGASRTDLAAKKVQNLLAARHPSLIPVGEIRRVFSDYGVTSPTEIESVAYTIYRKALHSFGQDRTLTETEKTYLEAIHKLLNVSTDSVMNAEREVLVPVYQAAVEAALSDVEFTELEKKELATLAENLNLQQYDLDKVTKTVASETIDRLSAKVAAGEEITAESAERLQEFAKSVNISLNETTQRRTSIAIARGALSKLEELPAIPVSFPLRAKEICYLSIAASWSEMRKQRSRGESYDNLKEIDTGKLYVTNQRLFFDGASKATSVLYKDIMGITAYQDAILLKKGSGRSPYLRFPSNDFVSFVSEIIDRARSLNSRKVGLNAEITGADNSGSVPPNQSESPVTRNGVDEKALQRLLGELESLVGLEPVKHEIKSLVNLVRVNELRRTAGLKVPPSSYHMVFSGPPGTGKTTIGRLVGGLFHALGLLSKGTPG